MAVPFSTVIVLVFAIVQFVVLLMTVIIRYHFRRFLSPTDMRAARVITVFTGGVIGWFFISGALCLFVFWSYA